MSNFLVGKTINKMMIADDNLAILFQCADGDHIVRVDGDCCSSSWIESIELPALGFPAEVIQVSDLDLPGSDDNHPEHECLAVYGCKLTTSKGDIVIDYRNSSNGYYGGNLSWPNEYFYGGVGGQNESTLNFVEIEE